MVYSVDCGVLILLLDVWLMRRESVKRAAVARLLREVWSTRREMLTLQRAGVARLLREVWSTRREMLTLQRAGVARLLREVWSTRRERLKRGLQVVCQLKIMVFCWCALKGFNSVLFSHFPCPPPPPPPPAPFFCLFCCDPSHEHLQTFLIVSCRIYDSPFFVCFCFFFLFLLEVHKVILLIIILALV